MAVTTIGVNDPKAVKRFSGELALDVSHTSYFGKRFTAIGKGKKVPIQVLTELENEAGEQISYDLLTEMRMAPVEGDGILEGKEEAMKFYTDTIYIDQARCGENVGGAMSRKRTIHDLRLRAKDLMKGWWARFQDELTFTYLSGSRGVNENFILPPNYAGRANNPLLAPTVNQHLFGGNATATANLTAADRMDLDVVGRAKTRADSQGGGASDIPVLQPCNVNGEDCYVLVMHTWQEDDLRSNTSTGGWLDLQKSAAAALGAKSPLFQGSLGMYRNVILHSHPNVIRHKNHGSTGNLETARALFMGAQAGVMAFGSPGTGLRYTWREENRDNGNQIVITSSAIFGVKKTQFNINGTAHDFGVYAIDTAAPAR